MSKAILDEHYAWAASAHQPVLRVSSTNVQTQVLFQSSDLNSGQVSPLHKMYSHLQKKFLMHPILAVGRASPLVLE